MKYHTSMLTASAVMLISTLAYPFAGGARITGRWFLGGNYTGLRFVLMFGFLSNFACAFTASYGDVFTDQYMMDLFFYATVDGSQIAISEGSIATLWTPSGILAGQFTPSQGPIQSSQFAGGCFYSKTYGEEFVLKFYDSETERFYVSNETITFQNNGSIGNLVFPYEFGDLTELPYTPYAFSGGVGTLEDPYLVSSREDLEAINHGYYQDKHYIMVNDIDLSGESYTVSIIPYNTGACMQFVGSFNGLGHKIYGVGINSELSYTGVFGNVGSGGLVENLVIDGCIISGSYYTGNLCGRNGGAIVNCYSTGVLSGNFCTGGLCGSNSGSITNSCSTSTVSGNSCVGGLCGGSYGVIANSYATGSVTGTNLIGGLCGLSNGEITNCFWNIETSGISVAYVIREGTNYTNIYSTDGVAEGITTAQMQTQSTFTDAGWDFESIWYMDDYPKLYDASSKVIFDSGEYGEVTEGSSVQDIRDGGAAVSPTVTSFAGTGWIFCGWDADFTNVTEDLTVTALYEPGFIVTFNSGEYGSVSSGETRQEIPAGGSATAPVVTSLAGTGWIFSGWDTDFSNVTEDLTVTALYEPGSIVTFNQGEHGSITAGETRQEVPFGTAAAAPEVTADDGYTFIGWSPAFFVFVVTDLAVTAQYSPDSLTVTFAGGEHGSLSGEVEQQVDYGTAATAPTVISETGWHFIGWDTDFSNVTDNITVTALYEIDTFTVTFDGGEHGSVSGEAVQLVNYAASATAPDVTPETGWHLTGWDTGFSNVTSDLTVTALYAENVYIVTFNQGVHGMLDGELIQLVEHGSAAMAPTVYSETGYIFVNWDADFSSVTADVAVTAIYTESFSGGSGTAQEPYLVGTVLDLTNINAKPDKFYRLAYDIDLSCESFSRAVIAYDTDSDVAFDGTAFTGSFEGAGHCITGLTINGGANHYNALFGKLGDGAIISNLSIDACSIVSTGYYTSALAGSAGTASVSGCKVSGHISGGGISGAIVAYNGAVVSNCSNAASVSGTFYAGGISGYNVSGEILNCYNCGAVSAPSYVAAIAGANTGSLSGCFWDNETTGLSASDEGSSLTTAEMQTQASFTGWDFYGESENGSDEIWNFPQGGGYPVQSCFIRMTPDIVSNGHVGTEDLGVLAGQWLIASCEAGDFCAGADLNLDGKVGLEDYAILSGNWLMEM